MSTVYQLPIRLRRLRQHTALRNLVRQTQLSAHDFIYPLFIHHGKGIKNPIASMPGQFQFSLDNLEEEVLEIERLGIPGVILFAIPEFKDARGSIASDPSGLIQKAIQLIKLKAPNLLVMTDLCFCEYTDHGHCGVLSQTTGSRPLSKLAVLSEVGGGTERRTAAYIEVREDSSTVPTNKFTSTVEFRKRSIDVDNDQTLIELAKQAVSHAQAGADVIAPSGMIDGMVSIIRLALDQAGYTHLPILSYAVKYASAFYAPFREAAQGSPKFGDRKTYQMDPGNATEGLREARQDILEGADMLMVKPAHTYLDMIFRIKQAFPEIPLAGYHVSGEYALIKAAAEKGWVNEVHTMMEVLLSIKRAGADFILTYFAKEAAKLLQS